MHVDNAALTHWCSFPIFNHLHSVWDNIYEAYSVTFFTFIWLLMVLICITIILS